MSSLIGQYFWGTLIGYELVPEGSCHGFSRLAEGDDSFCIPFEEIHDDQDVHISNSMGVFYCQKVHMD